MKKLLAFSKRNLVETMRDPLSFVFCLALPLLMLILLSALTSGLSDVPPNFRIREFASGICVFGYTFVGLFVAMQIAGDKNTAFIKRINISPIGRVRYYLSFVVSSLPIALLQTVLFFLTALLFGYPLGGKLVLNILYLLPSAIFYIFVGILIGCICRTEKQTGPISSVFITLTGMLGGVFMPSNLFKGGFATFLNILPFCHSTLIGSEIFDRGASCIYPHILILLGYVLLIVAVVAGIEGVRAKRK